MVKEQVLFKMLSFIQILLVIIMLVEFPGMAEL